MSRAIDRATRWEFCLEQAGFIVTREYSENVLGHRQVRFETMIGHTRLSWFVVLDTPRTRFGIGSHSYTWGGQRITKSPSRMSQWIFAEIEYANYKADQTA